MDTGAYGGPFIWIPADVGAVAVGPYSCMWLPTAATLLQPFQRNRTRYLINIIDLINESIQNYSRYSVAYYPVLLPHRGLYYYKTRMGDNRPEVDSATLATTKPVRINYRLITDHSDLVSGLLPSRLPWR
jgi:hypothetical protein